MRLPRTLNFMRHQVCSVPTGPTATILGRALRSRRRHDGTHQPIRPMSVLAAGRREMGEVKIVAAVALRTLSEQTKANP
jgi:hypothetical protein